MSVSVIISTYNNPAGLRMCLLGMMSQTVLPDQMIIADDGSNQAGYEF
ncbi:glycosyltransferase [Pirellulales bacterium]|nr:glycosyltransferase [Pirellulales bacterium]